MAASLGGIFVTLKMSKNNVRPTGYVCGRSNSPFPSGGTANLSQTPEQEACSVWTVMEVKMSPRSLLHRKLSTP